MSYTSHRSSSFDGSFSRGTSSSRPVPPSISSNYSSSYGGSSYSSSYSRPTPPSMGGDSYSRSRGSSSYGGSSSYSRPTPPSVGGDSSYRSSYGGSSSYSRPTPPSVGGDSYSYRHGGATYDRPVPPSTGGSSYYRPVPPSTHGGSSYYRPTPPAVDRYRPVPPSVDYSRPTPPPVERTRVYYDNSYIYAPRYYDNSYHHYSGWGGSFWSGYLSGYADGAFDQALWDRQYSAWNGIALGSYYSVPYTVWNPYYTRVLAQPLFESDYAIGGLTSDDLANRLPDFSQVYSPRQLQAEDVVNGQNVNRTMDAAQAVYQRPEVRAAIAQWWKDNPGADRDALNREINAIVSQALVDDLSMNGSLYAQQPTYGTNPVSYLKDPSSDPSAVDFNQAAIQRVLANAQSELAQNLITRSSVTLQY